MGVGRLAPHRVRARYAQALKEIPLPVKSFGGIDPEGLATVAETHIGGRRVRIGVLYAIPRLWITFPDILPPVLGFVTGFATGFYRAAGDRPILGAASADQGAPGLGTGRAELHITEPDHLDWARQPGRAQAIKHEAIAAWLAAQRECEG